ncbi:MAG TPA: type II toxin-antitoxin system VapC family toxin [Thermoanaerobaculia bacterium]|nr:type II toxin-antitoxin system VapC family toxin [Thermoanaerobaculia bacterium]
MAFLIDTSIFIAIERSGGGPSDLLEDLDDEPVALSAITGSELLHGVHRADSAMRRIRREAFVERILSTFPVIPFTLEMARVHSRIWADLQAKGVVIGAHDLLIAATALTEDRTVATRNLRHFDRIPDLKTLSW